MHFNISISNCRVLTDSITPKSKKHMISMLQYTKKRKKVCHFYQTAKVAFLGEKEKTK